MKIALIINGSRGDVQPMVALATGMMKHGHEVIFCAPPENEELVKRYNCPFVPFGINLRELYKQNPDIKGGITVQISPKEGKKLIENQINVLPGIVKGSDLILGAGIIMGVPTVADLLKVPYRLVAFYPMILGTTKHDPLFNRLMFRFGRSLMNLLIRSFINNKRANLGLKPINDFWQYWLGENVIIACDRELNAARTDVSFAFTQTGYMLLPSKNGLPANVEGFLNSGKPPVYIGFGSNPISSPEKYGQIFNEVSKVTNQRLIVSKGWADLPENNTSDILYVDDIAFDLLFPCLSAIVYHGGTGTMAAAARSGVPQVAFPFITDQFENRKQIVKLGLGPNACDFKEMTAGSISSAITECIINENYRKNAVEISQRLQNVNGLELTVNFIEKEFKK